MRAAVVGCEEVRRYCERPVRFVAVAVTTTVLSGQSAHAVAVCWDRECAISRAGPPRGRNVLGRSWPSPTRGRGGDRQAASETPCATPSVPKHPGLR